MTTLSNGVPFHGPLQPSECHSRPICDPDSRSTLVDLSARGSAILSKSDRFWTVRLNTLHGSPLEHTTGSSCGGLWPWKRCVRPFLSLALFGTPLPDAHSRVRFRHWQGHSSTIPARSRRGEWWTPIPPPFPSSARRVAGVCAS